MKGFIKVKKLIFSSLILIALCGENGVVNSATILDQVQESRNRGGYIYNNKYLAQTFIPSISGTLNSIDLLVDTWQDDPGYPTVLSIAKGNPGGVVVGETVVTAPDVWWQAFDLSSENIYLDAGIIYSIIMSNDDPGYDDGLSFGVNWNWSDNPYADGELWIWEPISGWYISDSGTADLSFRTYMSVATVPLPPAAWLFGSSLIGIIGLARRKISV